MYFKSGSSVVMTDNDLNETIQEIVLTKTWIAFTTKWISLSRELVYNTTWRSIFDDMSYSQVSNRRHRGWGSLQFFPTPLPPHTQSIRNLRVMLSATWISVFDDMSCCTPTQELVYSTTSVSAYQDINYYIWRHKLIHTTAWFSILNDKSSAYHDTS